MIQFPITKRAYTKIEALLDYFCNIKNDGSKVSLRGLSFRWLWPKSTVADFIKYIESARFPDDNRTLYTFITKTIEPIARTEPVQIPDKKTRQKRPSHPKPIPDLTPDVLGLSGGDRIDHPFSGRFTAAWEQWIAHRKREGMRKYKSIESEQTAVNKLIKDCEGREDMAIEMIECSISHIWTGIYADAAVKKKYKTSNRKKAIQAAKSRTKIKTEWSQQEPETETINPESEAIQNQ